MIFIFVCSDRLLLMSIQRSEADVEGKIFLGGLTWQTTEEMLKTHFGKWGSLNDVILMRNKITGEPRGFGFVQFQESTCGSLPAAAGVMVVENSWTLSRASRISPS